MHQKIKKNNDTKQKFELTSLPLCGAKTRNGGACKRRGSKLNGRCKFHGGKSTGPKTRTGKLNSSKNAGKRWPDWAMGRLSNKDKALFEESLSAVRLITHRLNTPNKPITDTELNLIVSRHRVALEVMKFAILYHEGEEAFILLQSALDHYYQDLGNKHLACHVHFKLITSPYFPRNRTITKDSYLDEYLGKAATKEMRKLDRDFEKMFSFKLSDI